MLLLPHRKVGRIVYQLCAGRANLLSLPEFSFVVFFVPTDSLGVWIEFSRGIPGPDWNGVGLPFSCGGFPLSARHMIDLRIPFALATFDEFYVRAAMH